MTGVRTADPDASGPTEVRRDSKRTTVDAFLHSLFGTVFAVAVAALALWPHVRPLIE